jgi:hypothetical protein
MIRIAITGAAICSLLPEDAPLLAVHRRDGHKASSTSKRPS